MTNRELTARFIIIVCFTLFMMIMHYNVQHAPPPPYVPPQKTEREIDKYFFYGQNALHDPFEFEYKYESGGEVWPVSNYIRTLLTGNVNELLIFSLDNEIKRNIYRSPILTKDQIMLSRDPEQ